MKKITFLIALLFTYSAYLLNAQTSIWNEDFDDNTQYTVTLGAEGNDGTADYFQRTDGSNINKTYTGKTGTYFFAGQDIDDTGWPGSANPSELTWSSISSISGYTSLQFKGYFASTATAKIDDSDYLHVQYQIDGGGWTNLIWFENDGSQYNTYFLEDTDFDGTGDGTQLTATFLQFTKSISGTGSSIELRITCAANAGDEDFAIDYLEVLGTAPGGVDNPTNFAAVTADVDQIDLSWTQNGNSDDVMVAWSSDGVFGTPSGTYSVDDPISGGGTVIFNGSGTSTSHSSLTADTRYYYSAWSVDGTVTYSSGVTADTTTYAAEPTTDATSPSATANSTSEITVAWTDATRAPGNYIIKGSEIGYGSITNPVDGIPEANGTLVQNVESGIGSFQFTGLTPSTTYYFKIYPYNGDNGSVNYKTDSPAQASETTDSFTAPNAWINELHYDNIGTDAGEFVEIVIENAGTYTLSDFQLDLYNGSNGESYNPKTLDLFTVGSTEGNYTFYYYTYPSNGIQNGAPDGLALSYTGVLIPDQFLSYEGSFTATNGPADGNTSTDIGVSESNSTTEAGESLQLKGGGLSYDLFYWEWPRAETPGALNNKQYLSGSYTTWTGATDNDWSTASNWNNGVPDEFMNVIIPDELTNYPTLGTAGSCIDIRMESGSALVGVNNLTASGTSTVERYISGYSGNTDGFHFLSSPVASFTIAGSDFDPVSGTDDFFSWDEATNTWLNFHDGLTDTEFLVGKGYLVAYSPENPGEFSGSLNTASVPRSLSYTVGEGDGWNLLGNPYPSAIDWDLLSKSASVNGSVYVLRGSDNTYVSWNGTSGDLSGGEIPVNNGFFVKADATSQSVTIDPADQVHSTSSFLKSADEAAENTLVVSIADNGFTNNTYVQFRADGTTDFDNAIDAYKLFGSSDAPQLYTLLSETEYAINCLPFTEEHYTLPMGFLTGAANEYTISADGFHSFTNNSFEVSLEDLETGDIVNLENETYTFTSNPDTDDSRFVLHFYGAASTGETPELLNGKIYTYRNNVYVQLNNDQTGNYQVEVINMVGQQVYSNDFATGGLNSFKLNEKPGVYFVRLRAENKTMVQKVMISK